MTGAYKPPVTCGDTGKRERHREALCTVPCGSDPNGQWGWHRPWCQSLESAGTRDEWRFDGE